MRNFWALHSFFYFLMLFSFSLPTQVFAADEGAEENSEEAIYFELSPPFVVNLNDSGKRIRFLQARIQVLAYGASKIEKVKLHDAPIRDALIMLLSAQSKNDINTSQKKKALQEKALKVVKEVLKKETGRVQIDGLYFTNFVTQ
ncbi:MAG: flagellar basal body-associated FliL family protein [Pseudomonadota bacterium]